MKIEEAVIMITGASSGIGQATARAALQAGARVILLARRKDRLDALADGSGKALAVACDVTQPGQIANAVRQGLARFGHIDVLINNAGQGLYAAVEEIEAADFRALLELNLITPLMMMHAVIPPMRRQGAGRIINVSSGATLATYPGSAAYTSSKAGLNMLSGVARLELAEAGITVSTVYPFMTRSEFYQSVKSGQEAAIAQAEQSAAFAHAPERVAEKILAMVESGEAKGDLVPRAWGGTCDD
ncbi:SDR family oxidoreductase [Pantoea sp. JKS000250]|uniref:SDR family oxidoreductase n=1 Tax=Pantoea sp. JKS000250 TaxID=1938795 RepID=UPI000D76B491|nr:SDR family oxidoreductase [Pantoea sp. JKS000250]PXW19201.1 NADP-dependent 3-hydroxy acid dehydrogenase YdfG [Pantoea sp. JKS000250]